MSNPTANDLPQDIATKISEYFGGEENKLVTIVQFFTNPASQLCTPRYFQILRSVGNNKDAFRMIIDGLVEDIEKNTDPLDKILDEIRKHLKGSREKLNNVLDFFADREKELTKGYIRILKSVSNDEKTFHAIVDELAQDLEKTYGLPQYILNKIAQYLTIPNASKDKLANVLRFFSDYDDKITKWYIDVLSAVYDNDRAFHDVVDKLAIDTEKLKNDPSYLSIMADIWNNLLKTILFKKNLIAISAANSFIGTLSQLQPKMQNEIVQLTIKAAATVAHVHPLMG